MMEIGGVDEAGKGPVIGPMVVCGVKAEPEAFEELRKAGVKDSKMLSRDKREKLYDRISKLCKIKVIIIEAEELNTLMEAMTINEVLYRTYSSIIKNLKPDFAYVDSSDVNCDRLSKRLKKETGVEVKAMHRADSERVEVAAASVVAKVLRDRRIEEIKREIGDFGSGYASDPRTIDFLKDYYIKNGRFPEHVRLAWKTLKRIRAETVQKTLGDF